MTARKKQNLLREIAGTDFYVDVLSRDHRDDIFLRKKEGWSGFSEVGGQIWST